ncbi:MAG: BamA/OMP85 family outer membrane protein [Verrucomicrobiota bacterium JB025]|nr:BamA/TamA family outer membrane protein [Verrucomicrobiota bacterium JB025]
MSVIRIIVLGWLSATVAGAQFGSQVTDAIDAISGNGVASEPETRVRVKGMAHKSEQEVLDLLGGRLTHVQASPAAPSRADDAAFLLRKMLINDGYQDARVEWRISGPRRIVLTVSEGQRLELGKVEIRGLDKDDVEDMVKLFSGPAEKDMRLGGDPAPFREEDLATGLSYLQQEYFSRGYWAAESREVTRKIDKETGAVDLVLEVVTGEKFRIAQARVTSPDAEGRELVSGAVGKYEGKVATTANINAMRFAAEELVASQGYPDASVSMTRELESGFFKPAFAVELGTRVRLGKVRAHGLERTNPARIARRVAGLEGEWYDEAAMNKMLRGFLSTGAFSAVQLEKTEVGEHLVDATLHFTESRAKELTLGLGAGSYEGVIMRAGFVDRNFMGELLGLSSGLEYSLRGLLFDVRLTNPWLLGTDTSGSVRMYALQYGREGYDSAEAGLTGSIRHRFNKHAMLDLSAGISHVEISGAGLPDSILGEASYQNPRIKLVQTFDYRDNAVLPTKGWHLQVPLEFGAAVADVSSQYFRAGISGGWYHAFDRKLSMGIGGHWEALIPSGDSDDLPIDLRVFNGGARTVRSFPERELGPRVDEYATGGEVGWSLNAELMRSIGGPAKAVWFMDAGALDQKFSDMGASDIELATGLGIRLDLPIGPVRFEYGYNLTRGKDEPTGAFHFAIGAAY